MMTMGNYLDENGDFYLTKNTFANQDLFHTFRTENTGRGRLNHPG